MTPMWMSSVPVERGAEFVHGSLDELSRVDAADEEVPVFWRAPGAYASRAALAASVETLVFAGEATSLDGQAGTVSGAILTGERAAREAQALLR